MEINFSIAAITFLVLLVTPARNSKQVRIIGGHDTIIEKHPHQVALTRHGSYICGGSIIGRKWVLSAAHCNKYLQYEVNVGSKYLSKGGRKVEILHKYPHPSYRNPTNSSYDYLLLELVEELKYGPTVQPIALGDERDIVPGNVATVTGWGISNITEKTHPEILQELNNMTLLRPIFCALQFHRHYHLKTMICASVKGGSTCFGDSGGPLTTRGKLIGMTIFGVSDLQGKPDCSPSYPEVFANVPAIRGWIQSVSGI